MPTIITGGKNPHEQEEQNKNEQVQNDLDINQGGDNDRNNHIGHPIDEIATPPIALPTIVGTTVPVVVFVGPPASGKSMILVRLAKYLRSEGYTIETDPTFLNTADYQRDCEEFKEKLNTNVALEGTVKFLLVKVYKDSREVAKLLEAPGEDFYTTDPSQIKAGKNEKVESYLSTIMTSANPKSYVVLLDLDSDISFRINGPHRDSYSQRFLDSFYKNINRSRDRIVLLYNKIDKTPFGSIHGCTDVEGARKDAEMYYRQWFSTMKRKSLGGFITSDNFVFKTFCTGMFSDYTDENGRRYQTYNVANDVFPRELWKEITRRW